MWPLFTPKQAKQLDYVALGRIQIAEWRGGYQTIARGCFARV